MGKANTSMNDRRALTDQEMDELSEWASDEGTYGFFQSSYYDVRFADYNGVFYNGEGISDSGAFTQAVEDEYVATGHDVMFDILCYSRDDLKAFLHS